MRSHATFDAIEQQQNRLDLLKLIKTLTHTYDNTKIHNVDALDTYKWQYMTMKKQGHQSLGDFYQQFQAHVHMCEEMGVQLYEPALATSIMADRGGTIVTEDDKQNAHKQAVAMRFIRACGQGDNLQHIRNTFLDGKDIYPKKILDAFAIMDQCVPNCGTHHISMISNNNDANTGIAYSTQSTSTTTSVNSGLTTQSDSTMDKVSHSSIAPPDNGAYLSPHPTTQSACTHSGITFSIQCNHNVPATWILLDNQATVDVFGNAALLHNIHDTANPLYIRGITGVQVITKQGNLPGHGLVWYDPHVSVNILSMAKLKQHHHITYDSDKENAFIVRDHKTTCIRYTFNESHDGLYYYDFNNTQQAYITTVTENKQNYGQSDIKKAEGA